MGNGFDLLIKRLRDHVELETIAIDPDLAAPKTNNRGMRIRCYNWQAEQFSKITLMDTSVEIPPMHQLNAILYPHQYYDCPIFLFLRVVTKSNIIAIFNANCPFNGAEYTATYIDPLASILERSPPFAGRDRYPNWFEKYRTPATIFGVFGKDQLELLTECGLSFLETYLQRVARAKRVEDPDRLLQIAKFHEQFKEDIRNKDRGRGVLEKLTDEETARRIFYEVAT